MNNEEIIISQKLRVILEYSSFLKKMQISTISYNKIISYYFRIRNDYKDIFNTYFFSHI